MSKAAWYPLTSDSPPTRTLPVISFVTPRLTPWRMKKVASVTMKLGSFVFTTIIPLTNPMVAAKTKVKTIANQMFMSSSVASSPITRPALPVMTPADRSNSPPIMSSATATAGIPRVDATSVQLAAPSSVPN
jgi:hypothetical protein